MSIFTNTSIAGFLSGALCLLLVEAGAGLLFMSSFAQEEGNTEMTLGASSVPVGSRLWELAAEFSDLAGQTRRLHSLRGSVVLLNLWATWCPPCRAEMPSLENLWKRFHDRPDIAILCISDEVLVDVRSHPFPKTVAMPLYVFTSDVPAELTVPGLPTTFIFDREGRLVFKHTGMAQWDAPEVVAYLEELLNGQQGRRE